MIHRRATPILALAAVAALSVGCLDQAADDPSARFAECLERNGIEARDIEVSMDGGTIESLGVTIISEGDVPYDPTIRLACTEEIEQAFR